MHLKESLGLELYYISASSSEKSVDKKIRRSTLYSVPLSMLLFDIAIIWSQQPKNRYTKCFMLTFEHWSIYSYINFLFVTEYICVLIIFISVCMSFLPCQIDLSLWINFTRTVAFFSNVDTFVTCFLRLFYIIFIHVQWS